MKVRDGKITTYKRDGFVHIYSKEEYPWEWQTTHLKITPAQAKKLAERLLKFSKK